MLLGAAQWKLPETITQYCCAPHSTFPPNIPSFAVLMPESYLTTSGVFHSTQYWEVLRWNTWDFLKSISTPCNFFSKRLFFIRSFLKRPLPLEEGRLGPPRVQACWEEFPVKMWKGDRENPQCKPDTFIALFIDGHPSTVHISDFSFTTRVSIHYIKVFPKESKIHIHINIIL